MLPYHARHRQSTRPAVTRPSPRPAEPLTHRETRKHEILTGIALWRSQAMPRWLPVLFVVALLAGALAPPGIVSVPLSLPFVIVMMLLARRIWDTAPER